MTNRAATTTPPARAAHHAPPGGRSSWAQLLDGASQDWHLPRTAVLALAAAPLILAVGGALAAFGGKGVYKLITREDGVAEWLQVCFYGASFLLCGHVLRRLRYAGRSWMAALYVLLFMGLFFMIGEELSWGQRLFGWSTPEAMVQINKQKETNLHNIQGVGTTFKWLQFVVGAYGTLLPLALLGLRLRPLQRATAELVIPHSVLIPYFAPMFLWKIYRNLLEPPARFYYVVSEYNEVMELVLSMGFFLFLLYQQRVLASRSIRRTRGGNPSSAPRAAVPAHAPAPAPAQAASPLFLKLSDRLDGGQVQHSLLRGAGELDAPQSLQEIDLLVHPHDLKQFRRTASDLGFVSWPAWGHEPHEFWIGYDPQVGKWLKLDVVTRLHYGRPIRCLEMKLVPRLLSKRRHDDSVWMLAPEDEFLTLLLHCILDKDDFSATHKSRLTALWDEFDRDRVSQMRLVETLTKLFGAGTRTDIEWAMDRQAWEALTALRPELTRRLFGRQWLAVVWRRARTRLRRRLRPFLLLLNRRGTSTVLLAPDGGGKSTLAAALAQDPWLRARVVYMGGNAAPGSIGLRTTAWLKRQLGARQWRLSPARLVLKLLYTFNHMVEDLYRKTYGELQRLRGRFVVYDRYFYDSYLSWRAHTWRVRLRRWLLERTSPRPDLVLVLDAPGEVLYARKGEQSPERLEEQRHILLALAKRIGNVAVLDASQSFEEVRRRALAAIWGEYRRHV